MRKLIQLTLLFLAVGAFAPLQATAAPYPQIRADAIQATTAMENAKSDAEDAEDSAILKKDDAETTKSALLNPDPAIVAQGDASIQAGDQDMTDGYAEFADGEISEPWACSTTLDTIDLLWDLGFESDAITAWSWCIYFGNDAENEFSDAEAQFNNAFLFYNNADLLYASAEQGEEEEEE